MHFVLQHILAYTALKEAIMWGYDDHDLIHIAEVRGGIRGEDSLPDLGADGGRLNRSAKLSGRDAYIARLEHMMDDRTHMEPPGSPTGTWHHPEADEEDENKESGESEDVEPTEQLRGRDLWLARLTRTPREERL
jgi:hypothetical protein